VLARTATNPPGATPGTPGNCDHAFRGGCGARFFPDPGGAWHAGPFLLAKVYCVSISDSAFSQQPYWTNRVCCALIYCWMQLCRSRIFALKTSGAYAAATYGLVLTPYSWDRTTAVRQQSLKRWRCYSAVTGLSACSRNTISTAVIPSQQTAFA
jgi:hypothetical protein